jgi:hypothetical protein
MNLRIGPQGLPWPALLGKLGLRPNRRLLGLGAGELRFDADPVVHGASNALLVAEVSLGRLN